MSASAGARSVSGSQRPHDDRLAWIVGTHRERHPPGRDPQAVPSRSNRQVAGVCGGLAQYFNLDATLIRILLVVLAVLGGSGIVPYLVMWIIVPNEPPAAA